MNGSSTMRVGIVHTASSPCGCAEAVAAGLAALGHEIFIVDSEDILLLAKELAATCDLVIDHTDTFLGWGVLRPFVRWELEKCGARVVGPSAQACFLADDKIAAKRSLNAAGVPTPPGAAITEATAELPPWLRPPLILKPACEHMSRGVTLAKTREEARMAVGVLLESYCQPVLVETFIPGRELAVSVLDGPEGLEILPILEWLPDGEEYRILTEAFKLQENGAVREDAQRIILSSVQQQEIESLSRKAFRTLGLRDYARFDVRLSPDGRFYFLEANTTPSLETGEALALSARWAGVDYVHLVKRILAVAQRRYGVDLTRLRSRRRC
ncbi:MAG: ATP-grasp domain-containing protein [Deltaproteobacteria bacterium]|nr:ATP-grasp domain-containing protein [Deltaproteobacteria bacterium]